MHISSCQAAKLVACAAAIVSLIDAGRCACAQSDAGAILDKYEAAVQSLRCAEYKARVVTYRNKLGEREKLHQDIRYDWRCNGDLAKSSAEGKAWNVYSTSNEVFDVKTMLLLDPRRDNLNMSWKPGGDVSMLMHRQPNEVRRRQVFAADSFTLLHGYLTVAGVPYLPGMLRQSRLSAQSVSLDQRPVVLLEGTGRGGRIKVWCDPETGFWPRKLELRRDATDVVEDGSGEKPREKTLAQLGAESTLVIVDGWDFTRIGAHWVPTAFTEQRTSTYTEARGGMATRSSCTISDIAIAPSHLKDPAAFEAGSEIPNGTRVTVEGQEQIPYVWRDGAAVKKIDADLGALEGHSAPRPGLPKSLLTLCTIALVMIAVVLVLWRRRAASR